ncbi:hypothetical protein [Vreelandella arcis]|uniref:Chain length determinant protein n=1 Tax=Vreelandella arcis TaxID=416873 RepID=A0A1H0ID62_9GAMM|nr:hypothetical protein [Halomonas arcis]SDO29338.1 hypothetical protein SAMN04487951_11950 [Halomonas arcis]
MSIEQPLRSTYKDDEISLIDLAKILIHRRWWFVITFVVVVLASGGWVLLQSGKTPIQESLYQYTTQLAVGYKTPSHLIEPLPSIIEQLNGAIIPKVIQQNEQFDSLTAKASYADNSNIVTVITESGKNKVITDFHEALTTPIVERHESLQQSLNHQLSSIFQGRQITQLIPSEVVALAVETEQPTEAKQGVNSKLIVVLGIMLGGLAGIVMAFLAEFVFRVRESLTAEKEA